MGEMGGAGRREESVLCKFGAMAGDRGVGTAKTPSNETAGDPRFPFLACRPFCQFSVVGFSSHTDM